MTAPHQDLRLAVGDNSHDLAGRVKDENGCRVYAINDGATFGNGEANTATLTSMMRDGDIEAHLGHGNREQTLNIVIEGPNLGAVALTEKRIQRDAGKPGELVWKPGDWAAQPNVFDVVWWELRHVFDPNEATLNMRRFTLTLRALPFARSLHEYVTTLTTGGVTPVVVDECESSTGWSAFAWNTSPSPTVSTTAEPAVRVSNFFGGYGDWVQVPAVVSIQAGDYLQVETYGQVPPTVSPVTVFGLATPIPLSGRTMSPDGGFRFVSFYGPAPFDVNTTHLRFGGSHGDNGPFDFGPKWWRAWASLDLVEFRQIEILDGHPSVGRQALLTFEAGGSAPTFGSLELHGSGPLGDVLVHTGGSHQGIATPAMSPYLSDVTTAPAVYDTTSPTGWRWELREGSGNRRWGASFPADQFNGDREQTAVLRVRLQSSAAGRERIYWSVDSRMNGVTLPGGKSGEHYHTFTAADTPEIVDIRDIPFPATKVGPSGSVRVHIAQESSGSSGIVSVTEGYVCRVGDDYATTLVSAGSHTRVFIDGPSVDDPRGSVWVGDDEDRLDAYYAGPLLKVDDVHTFEPEATRVWVASSAPNITLTERHFRRYHDHVTDPPPVEQSVPVT